MVKMVSFVLFVFYHNLKNSLKKKELERNDWYTGLQKHGVQDPGHRVKPPFFTQEAQVGSLSGLREHIPGTGHVQKPRGSSEQESRGQPHNLKGLRPQTSARFTLADAAGTKQEHRARRKYLGLDRGVRAARFPAQESFTVHFRF